MSDNYTDCRPLKSESKKMKQEEERIAELEASLKQIISQVLHPSKGDLSSIQNHTKNPELEVSEEESLEEKPDKSSNLKVPAYRKLEKDKPYSRRCHDIKNRKNTHSKQGNHHDNQEFIDSRDESSVNEDEKRTFKEDEDDYTNEDNSDCESSINNMKRRPYYNRTMPNNNSNNPLKRKPMIKKKDKLPLKKFHHSHHRNSPHADKDVSSDSDERDESPDEKLYCLCKKVSYGDMIACDNEKCRFEWFHFACVDVKVQPKGKWFCPDCRNNELNSPASRLPRRTNL